MCWNSGSKNLGIAGDKGKYTCVALLFWGTLPSAKDMVKSAVQGMAEWWRRGNNEVDKQDLGVKDFIVTDGQVDEGVRA